MLAHKDEVNQKICLFENDFFNLLVIVIFNFNMNNAL